MSEKIDPRSIEVVSDEIAQILRRKSPAERIQMVLDANDTARLLAAAGVRSRFPNWSSYQIEREVARRMLGASN